MSKGIGGWCYVAEQDVDVIIYQYGSFNLNDSRYINEKRLADGIIMIDRNCLVEPEIHRKIKHLPNGKKKYIVKRVEVGVRYRDLYKCGKIKIENCSNCWMTLDDKNDIVAWHFVRKIFSKYQEDGFVPEKLEYFT